MARKRRLLRRKLKCVAFTPWWIRRVRGQVSVCVETNEKASWHGDVLCATTRDRTIDWFCLECLLPSSSAAPRKK